MKANITTSSVVMKANITTISVVMKANITTLSVVMLTTACVCSMPNATSNPDSNKTVADSFMQIGNILAGRLNARLRIPPKFYKKPILLSLSYEPFQIITVDEVFQSITISCTVTVIWTDNNIQWDPKQYHDITRLNLPTNLFWTPTVLIPKTTHKDKIIVPMPDSLDVTFEGRVTADVHGFTSTLCNLDMANFPFDTHNCSIIFIEQDQYNMTSLALPSTRINSFDTSGAWILLGYGCTSRKTESYIPRFSYVICYVQMRRRSAFFITNMIVPIVLTSLMTLMVFWVPAETQEKVSFLLSLFTASSVYLNYMIDMIPRSMESLPRVNLLVVSIEVQIILATIATAFVLKRYKQETFQRQKRSKLWKLLLQRSQEAHKTSTLGVKSEQTGENTIGSRTAMLSLRINVVSPEDTTVSHCNEMSNRCNDKNSNEPIGKTGSDTIAGWASTNITGIARVKESRENLHANEGANRSLCFWNKVFTHDELDKLFFVLLLILTVLAYILALLG